MGSLDGVTDTESAWIGRYEVVTVKFDPERVSYKELLGHAKAHGCTTRVWTTNDAQQKEAAALLGANAVQLGDAKVRAAKASDQLYYLRNSKMRYLPLTPLQARRVNGAMYTKGDPRDWLSPRQLETLKSIEAALSKDSDALNGLQRPAQIDRLDEYEADLRKRL